MTYFASDFFGQDFMINLLSDVLLETSNKFPAKPAIIEGNRVTTYSELNQLACKVALVLRKLGVQDGELVGIFSVKNAASIIGINGILKAGSGYVPLDTHAPAKLIEYYIENSGVKCLLVSSKLLPKLTEVDLTTTALENIVLIDNDRGIDFELPIPVINWSEVENLNVETEPSLQNNCIDRNIAYMLYTSGSTGVPKGVITSHRNALAFVDSSLKDYEVKAEDIIANPAPLKFGISIFDVFVGIKAGATMVIIPELLLSFPLQLAEWIDKNKISVWFSVPFMLSRMVLDGEMQRFKYSHLRKVLFAGEIFPMKYLRKLTGMLPHVDYFNIYGTTETNILTHYQVPDLDDNKLMSVPVGKGISNMNVFLLDTNDQLVYEAGGEGEVCAKGAAVTMGYWKNPEKTVQNFVSNPLQKNYSEIIYRTGDLGRLDNEGNIHFLGRKDHMIKSRGYRIEVGEIESALYTHSAIKDAVVLGKPDDMYGNIIWAFITLHNDETLTDLDIKNHCGSRLPKYMIPEEVRITRELPKTSTGKIDKNTLLQEA